MNLQEQIAEFKAKGCMAGGRKWMFYDRMKNPMYSAFTFVCNIDYYHIEITVHSQLERPNNAVRYTFYCPLFGMYAENENLESTTLESALCEALDIVKAKVMDLAKELGYVCFSPKEMDAIKAVFNADMDKTVEKELGMLAMSSLILMTKQEQSAFLDKLELQQNTGARQ